MPRKIKNKDHQWVVWAEWAEWEEWEEWTIDVSTLIKFIYLNGA